MGDDYDIHPCDDIGDISSEAGLTQDSLNPSEEVIKEFCAIVAEHNDASTITALEKVIQLISNETFDLQVFRQ